MAARAARPVILSLAAASVIAVALVLVARSNAGSTQGASFSTFAQPTQVTSANTALTGAKFTPTDGSATHVEIQFVLSTSSGVADFSPITVTACPGTSTVVGNVVKCNIASVPNGQTAKLLFTYTAPSTSASVTVTITQTVKWDKPSGGGGTVGGTNSASSTSTVTVYGDGTHGGTCSSLANNSLSSLDATTGKGTSVTYGRVDSSFGFPCTPAQTGIDNVSVPNGNTPGVWSLLVPPLKDAAGNEALANATVTLDKLPSNTTWKKFQLFEIGVDPTTGQPTYTLVPLCLGAPPQDPLLSCSTGRATFGHGGVQIFLNVRGSKVDPSYTG